MQSGITKEIQYRKIAEAIRETIDRNHLKAGTPLLSAKALAAEWGVSLKTAQNAIGVLVAEGAVYRIGGSGTFVGPRPQSLRTLKIGCTLRSISENRNEKLNVLLNAPADRALEYLERRNVTIDPLPRELFYETVPFRRRITGLDGLLISGVAVNLDNCFSLRELPVPCVVFQSDFLVEEPVSQVLADHLSGIRQIFQIARIRYKGIIIIYGNHRNGEARKNAFLKAALENGYTQEQIHTIAFNANLQNAYVLGRRLSKECRGKLIISCSDTFSSDIISALNSVGLLFGKDYEIIGYDDSEGNGFHPFSEPTITSISVDNTQCALLAARLLLEKIRSGEPTTTIIRVPTRLTIRKTALNPYNNLSKGEKR